MKTYISLFSSAGVGCYGFKMDGFECISTVELVERRINVQMCNEKCKYSSGYICGDITKDEIKSRIFNEIKLWKKKKGLKSVDVIIATPPCQGMSVANLKKNDNDLIRNSLVIESIKIIKEIQPKFFIFENVPAFMKTLCTDVDGETKPICEAIDRNLGKDYSFVSKIINFKNYGASSSRQRTLVIGINTRYADFISPYELFPDLQEEKTLRDVIGNLPSLNEIGEIWKDDIYHQFRKYPNYMRDWIKDLNEGESAFDNEDERFKPHQVINGKIVLNKQKNGDKYKRQFWDKVGPCVHTRNDQLASQNTIHPSDDRVFSIRELMIMMTVPSQFKWSDHTLEELNNLSYIEKNKYLKKEEIKIRQSLGEAVPTCIFNAIAIKITSALNGINKHYLLSNKIFNNKEELIEYIDKNPDELLVSDLARLAELSNSKRVENAAFYTNKILITNILKELPELSDGARILEPSVGVGNFIFVLLKRFEHLKDLTIDVVDVDKESLLIFGHLLNKIDFKNVKINIIPDDFLLHDFDIKYDLVIGNPPFGKEKQDSSMIKKYKANAINKNSSNLASYFLDKAYSMCDYVALIMPKFILNTPEFLLTRKYLSNNKIDKIIDFGENGFKGVLIETVALLLAPNQKPNKAEIISLTMNTHSIKNQSYIANDDFPYWLIYRDNFFDEISKKLVFDVFDVFRDRQITKQLLNDNTDDIRVLKSRNVNDDGSISDINGYDSYINVSDCKKLEVYRFLDDDSVFLTPNMTYNPRVIRKPKGCLINGSLAILIPKNSIDIKKEQLDYFSSFEFRKFYRIARNYQTRSLNVDKLSVYFFGLKRSEIV